MNLNEDKVGEKEREDRSAGIAHFDIRLPAGFDLIIDMFHEPNIDKKNRLFDMISMIPFSQCRLRPYLHPRETEKSLNQQRRTSFFLSPFSSTSGKFFSSSLPHSLREFGLR